MAEIAEDGRSMRMTTITTAKTMRLIMIHSLLHGAEP
jgi:hypothetical protein